MKNVYDSFPELKLVFTSSSILQIFKGYADLSRRAVTYELLGLSFREYLEMTGVLKLTPLSLTEILDNHTSVESEITKLIRPLKLVASY